MNKELENIFLELALYYDASGNTRGANAFKNSAHVVKTYDKFDTDPQDIINIKGIGKSSYDIIMEYIETGNVSRLEYLRKQYPDMNKKILEFSSIYGVNTKTAVKFYNQGFRSLLDLWKYGNLNSAQKQGMLWRKHLEKKIPRSEMEEIEIYLKSKIKNIVIVGSYRRGELISGDIDVLVMDNANMKSIISKIEGKIVAKLAQGDNKFMGIFRMSDKNIARRIDIRICDIRSTCPYMLLYFTGSQQFNKIIRGIAKNKGYRLNEYGLINIETGDNIILQSENQIFDFLGLKYLDPTQRIRKITNIEELK